MKFSLMMAVLFTVFSSSGADSLEKLEKSFLRTNEEKVKLQKQAEILEKQVLELTRQIKELREKEGMFADWQLQRKLRKVKTLTDRGEKINQRVSLYEEKLKKLAQKLTFQLDQKIKNLLSLKKNGKILREIFKYQRKKEFLKNFLEEKPAKRKSFFLPFKVEIEEIDSPEEIKEKIDYLKDQQEKVRGVIKEVEAEIRTTQAKQSLSAELEEFLEEIDLSSEEMKLVKKETRLVKTGRFRGQGDEEEERGKPFLGASSEEAEGRARRLIEITEPRDIYQKSSLLIEGEIGFQENEDQLKQLQAELNYLKQELRKINKIISLYQKKLKKEALK
jgi:hypothetical protein